MVIKALKTKRSRFVYDSDDEDSDEQNETEQPTAKTEACRLVDLYMSMHMLNEDADPLHRWEQHQNSIE